MSGDPRIRRTIRASMPALAVSVAALGLAAPGVGSAPAFAAGRNLCEFATQQGFVPSGDICVTALRADVTGAGQPDLVILDGGRVHGAHAGRGRVSLGPYTLKVVDAAGSVLQSRIASTVPPALIVAAGAVSDEPGADLFIQVARISSGSTVAIYSDQRGRLVRSRTTLTYGGDSASRFGFSCRRSPTPEVIQRSYELLGPTIHGRWRETIDTYSFNRATLHLSSARSEIHHGFPVGRAIGIGAGCGALRGFG